MNSAENASGVHPCGGAAAVAAAAARVYRLPAGKIVRRAREWYLYDQDGTRYIDFWQADGAAFLGHRPAGFSRLAKAEIDRGLWTAVPSPWTGRLERALGELSAEVYPDARPQIEVVNGQSAAFHATEARWLPTGTLPTTDAWQLVVPAPGTVVPTGRSLTEISALLLALLTRGTYNLLAYLSSTALERRLRSAVETAHPPGYTRHGVWFVPVASVPPGQGTDAVESAQATDIAACRARWDDFAYRALTERIVLPPDPWTPIPIPGELQRTDQKQWEKVCNEWPQ